MNTPAAPMGPHPTNPKRNTAVVSPPQLESLVERLSGWRGLLVEVVEQITRRPGSLDRHCTTTSTLVMRLESAAVAFSGASLMVFGQAFGRDMGYQATLDLLERLEVGPDDVVFVERFGSVAERHSRFHLLGAHVNVADDVVAAN